MLPTLLTVKAQKPEVKVMIEDETDEFGATVEIADDADCSEVKDFITDFLTFKLVTTEEVLKASRELQAMTATKLAVKGPSCGGKASLHVRSDLEVIQASAIFVTYKYAARRYSHPKEF